VAGTALLGLGLFIGEILRSRAGTSHTTGLVIGPSQGPIPGNSQYLQ
jgi:hypothetical protein